MALVVDKQNAGDKLYKTMAPAFSGTAYQVSYVIHDSWCQFSKYLRLFFHQAAVDLCKDGKIVLNGYTEYVLHSKRQAAKASNQKSML